MAEQFHSMSRQGELTTTADPLDKLFDKLKTANLSEQEIIDAVNKLDIELVLTAHPTEVTRRTLIHKQVQLNKCLEELELQDLTPRESRFIQHRIEQLINQAWHTNEIRQQRPTPVDEAKWGFAVIENNLWPAIRITSYNVCYTKLLRKRLSRIDALFQPALPAIHGHLPTKPHLALYTTVSGRSRLDRSDYGRYVVFYLNHRHAR